MAQKPESGLQRRVQKALRAAFPGSYIRKIHVSEFAAAGTPDLICCIHGLFVGIEIKTPGRKPTKLQEHEFNEIIKAGGIAVVARTPEDAVHLCRLKIRNYEIDQITRSP
jgi:hypothetical protein